MEDIKNMLTECVVLTHLGPNRQTRVEGALFPVISREGIGQVVSPLDVGHPQVADHHRELGLDGVNALGQVLGHVALN